MFIPRGFIFLDIQNIDWLVCWLVLPHQILQGYLIPRVFANGPGDPGSIPRSTHTKDSKKNGT